MIACHHSYLVICVKSSQTLEDVRIGDPYPQACQIPKTFLRLLQDLVKSSYDKNFKETEDRHRLERERDTKVMLMVIKFLANNGTSFLLTGGQKLD